MESSNSLDSENSQEGEMGTPEHSNLACAQSRLFSQEVTDFLESLYRHGMTGWGKSHENDILTAIATTGLTAAQVKVREVLTLNK